MPNDRDEPFQKLFDQYCARKSIDPKTVHFMLDGEKIHLGSTPADEDLEGGEIIEVAGAGVGK